MRRPLTFAERWLRGLLIAHAIWSGILAGLYIVGRDTTTLGFIPNSFSKDVLFVVLSAVAAADVRRFGWLALVIAAGYAALVAGQLATLILGGAQPQDVPVIGEVPATLALLAWMAVDVALTAVFALLWAAAARSGLRLRYLHPIAFGALVALAEVLVEGRREALTPAQVARNVDGYLAALQARGRWRVQAALVALGLWPLLTLRPPLAALAPDTRKRFLERRFVAGIGERRTPGLVRPLLQAMIRTGSQMSYLGYYGDRRSWDSIGYTPYAGRLGARPPEPSAAPGPPLRSLSLPPRDGHPRYDTLVIGSGAAGGILAYRFAQAGRRVLVLERGPHADPREFDDDEVAQYLRLYNEGALQLATNFSLQVLQGMCVGGGTTVNNALCLPPPGPVLDAWAERGVERAALEASIEEVRTWLDVTPIRSRTTTIAAGRFAAAVEALGLPGRLEVMEANISAECRGTGYCNIGCGFGAKLSTLDSVLPWGQEDFPGRLDVLADFEVEQVVGDGRRATGVHGRHRGGERRFVGADEVVVAAGPIASSWLLQRSGIAAERAGRDLHFNINSPLTADFEDEVDSFAGIQMSHAYVAPGPVPGYLIETWFNPPATQALAMPGWFDEHFRNMKRYRHMACAGVLAGTTTPGRVTPGRRGPEIHFTPSEDDRRSVVEGLELAGRIFLRAGATRVLPATFKTHEFRSEGELDALDRLVREQGDLLLTSAHPQGGNAIGEQGVVGADFRVHGFENLYLCDASVFPTSVHVNPQLTVMGLANLAARQILGAQASPPPAAQRGAAAEASGRAQTAA